MLTGIIGPCPECGNGRLEAVIDGTATNFLAARRAFGQALAEST